MAAVNYVTIIPVKCDCCGEMVDSLSDRSEWFGAYLKPDEAKVCHDCIKDREGYAEEFLKQIGISMEALGGSTKTDFKS